MVEAIVAIEPMPWDEGIARVKTAILCYLNQVMARFKFAKMPAGEYADWTKWGHKLLTQAKTCDCVGYAAEQVAPVSRRGMANENNDGETSSRP